MGTCHLGLCSQLMHSNRGARLWQRRATKRERRQCSVPTEVNGRIPIGFNGSRVLKISSLVLNLGIELYQANKSKWDLHCNQVQSKQEAQCANLLTPSLKVPLSNKLSAVTLEVQERFTKYLYTGQH